VHGPLSEIGLADVLQLLERGRRSGVLRVVGPDPRTPRTLTLADGRITALEPDASDAAVAAGLSTRSLATLDPSAPDDGPGAIPREVRDGLRRRLATRALSAMLQWVRGRFDFEEHPVDPGPLSLSPDMLVFDVVEAESRREDLAGATADFHAVPDFAAGDAFEHGGPVELGILDWRILDAINGVRDVSTIAERLGEPLEDVAERIRELTGSAILVLRRPLAEEARDAVTAGEYDEAVRLLRARVATVPDDGDAWRALGLAEVGAGRFDRAVEAWTAWQGAAPSHLEEAGVLIAAARTMLDALREP
jgi:hypothetical protein